MASKLNMTNDARFTREGVHKGKVFNDRVHTETLNLKTARGLRHWNDALHPRDGHGRWVNAIIRGAHRLMGR